MNILIDTQLLNSLQDMPVSVKYAVVYGSQGLMFKYFIMFVITFYLMLIIHNIKEKYKYQRYSFYVLLILINFTYFLSYIKLSIFFTIVLGGLILFASMDFFRELFMDIQLQKVQNIKYKEISSLEKKYKRREYRSIREAFTDSFKLGLQMLIDYLDKKAGNIYLIYLIIFIIILGDIAILLYYLYLIYFGTQFFIK